MLPLPLALIAAKILSSILAICIINVVKIQIICDAAKNCAEYEALFNVDLLF